MSSWEWNPFKMFPSVVQEFFHRLGIQIILPNDLIQNTKWGFHQSQTIKASWSRDNEVATLRRPSMDFMLHELHVALPTLPRWDLHFCFWVEMPCEIGESWPTTVNSNHSRFNFKSQEFGVWSGMVFGISEYHLKKPKWNNDMIM